MSKVLLNVNGRIAVKHVRRSLLKLNKGPVNVRDNGQGQDLTRELHFHVLGRLAHFRPRLFSLRTREGKAHFHTVFLFLLTGKYNK